MFFLLKALLRNFVATFFLFSSVIHAPPNSLMDSTTNPKVKTTKGKGVGTHSLARKTLGVEGHVGTLGWGLGILTSKSIIHTDLQKPNNKLVSA
jgi:hypothetical protein